MRRAIWSLLCVVLASCGHAAPTASRIGTASPTGVASSPAPSSTPAASPSADAIRHAFGTICSALSRMSPTLAGMASGTVARAETVRKLTSVQDQLGQGESQVAALGSAYSTLATQVRMTDHDIGRMRSAFARGMSGTQVIETFSGLLSNDLDGLALDGYACP